MQAPNRIPINNRVLVSVNPRAGRRSVDSEIQQFCQLARERGLETTVATELTEVAQLANRWHGEGRLRALVGVGGDGTAAELVNRTVPGVPITLLGAGTANLLTRHFRLATDATRLVEVLTRGRTVSVDAGLARWSGAGAAGLEPAERVFLLMAGIGFDAEVVQRFHRWRTCGRRSHVSYADYLKPIFQSIRSYQYPEFRVYCEPPEASERQAERCMSARWAFVCNFPRYAWGLPMARAADETDGLLDIRVFSGRTFWDGLRYLAATQLGVQQRLSDCTASRTSHLRVEADQPVPFQLDGDPAGTLPLEIEVLPGRLTLLAPA